MNNNDSFIRDKINPGAILNTDVSGLKAYKLQKQKNKEVDQLKNEVKEIKSMLHLVLERLNK